MTEQNGNTTGEPSQVENLYLSKQQAAATLGISTKTLDRWSSQRKLPTIRVGGVIKFNKQKTLAWMDSHEDETLDELTE